MQLVLSKTLPKEFKDIWWTNCPTRYRVIYGARNTGKSYDFLGTEVLHKILKDPMRNIAIFRAVASDIKTTAFSEVKKALYRTGLFTYFQVKEHDVEVVYKATGQKIMFFGCDRGTAVNGIQVPIGEITDFYFEEAYELKDYELFRQIDGSLRGEYTTRLKNGVRVPKQVTFLMNPRTAEGCWIYNVFVKPYQPDDEVTEQILENVGYRQTILKDLFIEKGLGLALHQSAYKINHWRDKLYDSVALENKKRVPRIYRTEFLGMWGVTGEIVYFAYDDKLLLDREIVKELPYRAFYIGVDTAFSNGEGKILTGSALDNARVKHAYAITLCGITRSDYKGVEQGTIVVLDEYYYTQEIYGRRKTHNELISDTIDTILKWCSKYASNPTLLKGVITCFVDSGDQGSIDDLVFLARQKYLPNLKFMQSTKKPIMQRIRFVNQLMGFQRVRFSVDCKHLVREIKNCHEGKGKPREDVNDHAINAFEYGATPLFPLTKEWANFKQY